MFSQVGIKSQSVFSERVLETFGSKYSFCLGEVKFTASVFTAL